MVARKAWLPGRGTYSVESTGDVYDPTAGRVRLIGSRPRDATTTTVQEKQAQGEHPVTDPAGEATSLPDLQWYLRVASLANLAEVEQTAEGEWRARGAPTEIAIEVFAARFGCKRKSLSLGPAAEWTRLGEFPFDSDVKKMSVVYRRVATNESHVFTKVCVLFLTAIPAAADQSEIGGC